MICESCGNSGAKEYRNTYDLDSLNKIWCLACTDEDWVEV